MKKFLIDNKPVILGAYITKPLEIKISSAKANPPKKQVRAVGCKAKYQRKGREVATPKVQGVAMSAPTRTNEARGNPAYIHNDETLALILAAWTHSVS
jgi:hypothetical protein